MLAFGPRWRDLPRLFWSLLTTPPPAPIDPRDRIELAQEQRDAAWDRLQEAKARIRELENENRRLRAALAMRPKETAHVTN